MANKPIRKPFHETLAEKIIKQLENGTAPWTKPWEAGEIELPHNPTSGTRYRGANILALYGEADARWMTYKQASAHGWQVKKGETGTQIQYWKFYNEVPIKDESGKIKRDQNGKKMVKRYQLERPKVFHSVVFNARQIEGIPELEKKDAPNHKWDRHNDAELVILKSGVDIKHENGDRAYYSSTLDQIVLPEMKQFPSPSNYYATILHELGHSTGHESRLDRDLSGGFGSPNYAKEELRAEIASYLMGGELDTGHDPSNHISYIKSWIQAIKDDPMEIVRASSDAEKIGNYLLSPVRDQEKEKVQESHVRSDIQQAVIKPINKSIAGNIRYRAAVPKKKPARLASYAKIKSTSKESER